LHVSLLILALGPAAVTRAPVNDQENSELAARLNYIGGNSPAAQA
jgi:hypothetical protein